MRLSRELARREHWPRERLRLHQQERLEALVRHAVEHSPYYRERLSRVVGNGPVELSSLPVLDKAQMMEHYDELVTDSRLRRDELLAWVEEPQVTVERREELARSAGGKLQMVVANPAREKSLN
jgi:hypothetical protein